MRWYSLLSILLACLMLVGLGRICSKSNYSFATPKLEVTFHSVMITGKFHIDDVPYWRSKVGQEVYPDLILATVTVFHLDEATGIMSAVLIFHSTKLIEEFDKRALQQAPIQQEPQPQERSEQVGPRLQAAR